MDMKRLSPLFETASDPGFQSSGVVVARSMVSVGPSQEE